MNQKQLGYFLEVYKRNNITRAAEYLYISPQALSKTITSMENELGVSLFTHKSNRIIPTNEAAKLATYAKSILDEFDIIEHKLFHNVDTKKVLSVSCSYDIPQFLSADFFYHMYLEHPNIQVQLNEYTDATIINQLENNEIELSIFSATLNPQKYIMDPLFSDPFVIVVNKNHPLAQKDSISLSDLKDENIVIKDLNSSISKNQYSNFIQEGVIPKIMLETSDAHLIHQMAAKNYAIGMTLSFLAERVISDEVVTIPFKHKWFKKTLYLVYKRDFILSQESEIFRKELLKSFRDSNE